MPEVLLIKDFHLINKWIKNKCDPNKSNKLSTFTINSKLNNTKYFELRQLGRVDAPILLN